MATRKEARRKRALAEESQGAIRSFTKLIVLPVGFIYLIQTYLLLSIQSQLRAVIASLLLAGWVYWAVSKQMPGSKTYVLFLGFTSGQILDDLRDDIQDSGGLRLSRGRLAEFIVRSIYTFDSLLIRHAKAAQPRGKLLFVPEQLYNSLNYTVNGLSRHITCDSHNLNHASLSRTIVEAVCIAEQEKAMLYGCRSLEEVKQRLVQRLTEAARC
jgi:hypothetical protein